MQNLMFRGKKQGGKGELLLSPIDTTGTFEFQNEPIADKKPDSRYNPSCCEEDSD